MNANFVGWSRRSTLAAGVAAILVLTTSAGAQASFNVTLLEKKTYDPPEVCPGYGDCYGFEVGGREYAVVGCLSGVWIVETQPLLSQPPGLLMSRYFVTQPQTMQTPPDPATPLRDVVAYRTSQGRHFVFSVADDQLGKHPGLHAIEVTKISDPTPPNAQQMQMNYN